MIASTCAAFSSTRSARGGAWSGARCCREDSTRPRPVRAGRRRRLRRARAQRTEGVRRRTHGRTQRVLGLAELDVLGPGAPGTEYTVHASAVSSGSKSESSKPPRRIRSPAPAPPPRTGPGSVTSTASPEVTASRWNCVPAGRPRTSPGTGSAMPRAGPVRRGPGGRAQRLQQRHRTRIVEVRPRQAGGTRRDGIVGGYRMPWRPKG